MNKIKVIFILSIWVTILPYLGFPDSLKYMIVSVSGLVLSYLSYVLFFDFKSDKEEKTFDNFSENNNFNEKEVQ